MARLVREDLSKSEATRRRILDAALAQCSVGGLAGLTIGSLAEQLALSKSGLFAHFGSKEQLQVAVLAHAAQGFVAEVIAPALQRPRGLARLLALFEAWLERLESNRLPGGCPFLAAAFELDDQPGPAREELLRLEREFRQVLVRSITLCVEVGDFTQEVDAPQLAFEIHALMMAYHFEARLLGMKDARARVECSFAKAVALAQGKGRASYEELLVVFGLRAATRGGQKQ